MAVSDHRHEHDAPEERSLDCGPGALGANLIAGLLGACLWWLAIKTVIWALS
jgi:hypothetical protein